MLYNTYKKIRSHMRNGSMKYLNKLKHNMLFLVSVGQMKISGIQGYIRFSMPKVDILTWLT